MTESSPDSSRYAGRHRRTVAILDAYGLPRVAAALPGIGTRASRLSLGFVRTALSYRPETPRMRRGIAALGAAAVLSLSLMGTTPASGHAEGQHDTPAAASERNAADERAQNEALTKPPPQPNEPDKKEKPQPVAGLSKTQMKNAVKVVRIGEKMNISKRGQAVALVTAMQETKMKNLASHTVPESHKYDNDGKGSDHDSVGLFQQRPSMGWGSVKECMDVDYATKTFYKSLRNVNNWKGKSLAGAAQAVQSSAFPDAYAQWENLAGKIIDEVHK